MTENKVHSSSAIKIAKLIQHDIFIELNLTCPASVSYNKFLAKIASDYQKPHGLTVIMPELPVGNFHGVGKATLPKLNDMGIMTGKDFQEADPLVLAERFGVYGWELYLKANGIHQSQVKSTRERKSVSKERTYGKLLYFQDDVKGELDKLSEKVSDVLNNTI